MDERALRDVERWKDKIEVRLDNRQVFFLFFGSALVACLLFVLGVIVGKRLESRGRAVAPEIDDPLALLDKVAASPRAAVETGGLSKAIAPAPVAAPKPRPEPPVKAVAAEPRAAEAKVEARPEPQEKLEPAVQAKPEPRAEAPAAPGKPKFALQIGSFPDRAAAEAFVQRFSGLGPYIVQSDIPGKGIWFRVRVGAYDSIKDANAAKAAFEKQHSVIAYVSPK